MPRERVYSHVPVMAERVVDLVAAEAPARILDCTVGGAGHSRALLQACPDAVLYGLDRDIAAVSAATEALRTFGDRARVLQARFSQARQVLAALGISRVNALVADLGVSSHQLDRPERGFSFRETGPLDMRMDANRGDSLADILRCINAKELASAIRTFGEERHAGRVARAILEAQPTSTAELADVVRRVVRPSADGIDPATRTFQGLRILVNDEMGELDALLDAIPHVLADGGVAVVISFHSLEDRRVKNAFRTAARGCVCPSSLPACACGRAPTLELLTKKPMRPRPEETHGNTRARSAKLRAVRRLRRAG